MTVASKFCLAASTHCCKRSCSSLVSVSLDIFNCSTAALNSAEAVVISSLSVMDAILQCIEVRFSCAGCAYL